MRKRLCLNLNHLTRINSSNLTITKDIVLLVSNYQTPATITPSKTLNTTQCITKDLLNHQWSISNITTSTLFSTNSVTNSLYLYRVCAK